MGMWLVVFVALASIPVGCSEPSHTPRDVMASGLQKALSDEDLGAGLLQNNGPSHWASALTAGWISPMALTTDTLLDWTDGLNRIVIREKTAYRAEPGGRFEGERTWSGDDFQQPRRIRRSRAKGDQKRLLIAHEKGDFLPVEDVSPEGLKWRERLQGGWALYMDLVGPGIRWEDAGTTTRAGKVLARLTAVWNGQAAGSPLSDAQGQALLEGRRIENVDGEILIEPDSRILREGVLNYAIVGEGSNAHKRIQVTSRFETIETGPFKAFSLEGYQRPSGPADLERKFRRLRELQESHSKGEAN